jgi:DNA-binding transcriptional regulator LsrR (DeoR family)
MPRDDARTADPAPERAPERADDALRARASHLYFVAGLTQQEVGDRMGLSRMKVNRLLAEARERGIVRIEIVSPSAGRLALEAALAARYGLDFTTVTPAEPGPAADLSAVVGRYAAAAVRPLLRDGITVALGWGVTLKALAAAVAPAALAGATVAPLLGSLSRRSSIDRFDAAAVLAERLGAECFHLPAPIICDSAASRAVLHGQRLVREVLAKAAAADLALMSVGGRRSSTLRATGFVTEAEMVELTAAGAVGNFLGYFFDAGGRVTDHPINGRVIGLDPEAARAIPRRIMVSGGPDKIDALRVCLVRGWATGLVTDEATATALAR